MTFEEITVNILALDNFDNNLGLPSYSTKGAAGADVRACIGRNSLTIRPGMRVLIPTGLSFEIPENFEIQVRPRSGLSYKHSLLVLNSPGTIDCDYRGEVKIIMGNWGEQDEVINHGDRIAQLVLAPVTRANYKFTKKLSDTQRDTGGFGSTGVS